LKHPPATPIELHFPRVNGAIDDAVDNRMSRVGVLGPEIVREMIIARLRRLIDAVNEALRPKPGDGP